MTKQKVRDKIWALLESRGVSRFPGARGRIPNFTGAETCAGQVGELAVWKRANVIKANPDSPQRAIRYLALKQGKIVYMAVPRLREEKCFVELDPHRIGKNLYGASSIKGAFEYGRPVGVNQMKKVDLILCGSVAVHRKGARVGKGGGYSDLEYGIAKELGLVTARTPIITTVHRLQIVDLDLDIKPHDIPVDYIVTPDMVIETVTKLSRPKGVYWQYLDSEKIGSIPVLKRWKLRSQNSRR
jgi:5-formyltetrahydrofolate cyclo-ligase